MYKYIELVNIQMVEEKNSLIRRYTLKVKVTDKYPIKLLNATDDATSEGVVLQLLRQQGYKCCRLEKVQKSENQLICHSLIEYLTNNDTHINDYVVKGCPDLIVAQYEYSKAPTNLPIKLKDIFTAEVKSKHDSLGRTQLEWLTKYGYILRYEIHQFY